MPGVAHRRTGSTGPTQTSTGQTEAVAPAGGASQDQLRDALKDGGTAEGLANYRGTLGQWLGTELYTALAGELTFDKLQGHATKAWEGALLSMVDQLDQLDGAKGDSGLAPFQEAVKAQFGQVAAELMETDTGKSVVSKLNGWVDAHPKTVILVALLAAAGAVAANVDLPELKQKLKLGGGFTANVEAELGKIRDISLKHLKAELEYASGPLVAAASVDRNEAGDLTYGLSGKLGDDSRYLKADGKFTSEGLDVYGLHGLYKTDDGKTYEGSVTKATGGDPQISATVTTVDGDTTTIRGAKYDTGKGVLTLSDTELRKLDEHWSTKRELGLSSDGTAHAGGSVTYKGEHLSGTAGGTVRSDGTGELSASGTYKRDEREITLGGGVDTAGKGHLSGSVSDKLGEGLTGSARLRHEFGETSRTTGGLDLTYRGDEWAGKAGYAFDSQDSRHSVEGLVQKDLGGGWKGRAEGSLSMSDLGTSYEVGGQAYKKVNDDIAVFGGGSYRQDQHGGRFVPKAGVEVKGVPVEYSYDPATKQHKVGVTLFSW